MLGVIEVAFDPDLVLGGLTLRWQAVGVAVATLAALGVAVTRARGILRIPDMLLVLLGAVPGAIIGGRLVHFVAHLEAYVARPLAIFDPNVGSLSLTGAVLGGCASGLYVARLARAPTLPWADAAAIPLLVALAGGKLAQLLGGSGQGLPYDGPWAVAFSGAGPWISAHPELASHPSQLYESLWLFAGVVAVPFVGRLRDSRVTGTLFVLGLCWFLVGRLLVGFTWRDAPLLGPLNADQAIAIAAVIGLLVGSERIQRTAARQRPLPANGYREPQQDEIPREARDDRDRRTTD